MCLYVCCSISLCVRTLYQYVIDLCATHYSSTMYTNKTVLDFNCGFARTAVRELSLDKSLFGFHDFQGRQEKFAELFDIPSFGIPPNYFSSNPSKFDRQCHEINSYFSKKWKSSDVRDNYLSTFSIAKWKSMSINE